MSAATPDDAMHVDSQSNDSPNALAPIVSEATRLHSECPKSSSSLRLKLLEHTPPPASQHPPPQDGGLDQSDHVALLATCGITVRDFAYETTTLPPVTTVPRFSVQTQPRTRPLKRTRDLESRTGDGEESDVEDPSIPRTWYIDSSGTGVSRPSRFRKRGQALSRTLTEPADEAPPSQGLNTREGGFVFNLSRPTSPAGPSRSKLHWPATPQKPHRHAQTSSLSPLAIANNVSPSQQGESQETEPWIDTPLVTPNGSLQWPVPAVQNTNTLPASQLESVLPQLAAEDDMTLAQLGFSPARSEPRSQRAHASAPSPAGTPSRRRHDPQLPPPAEFRTQPPSSSTSPPPPGSPSGSSPRPETRPGSPRYHFRERAPAAAAPSTNANTKKPASRSRAQSRTRTAAQGARKTENAAPPVRKKQKPSPPADLPGRTTRYGQRKNAAANVEGVR